VFSLRKLAVGSTLALIVGLAAPAQAQAGKTLTLEASGSQHALAVRVEADAIVARACASKAACGPLGGKRFPLPKGVVASSAKLESIELAPGRRVALVQLKAADGRGDWVTVLAASDRRSAADVLQPVRRSRNRRTVSSAGVGKTNILLRVREGSYEHVLVGKRFDNAKVCGRPATMLVQQIDPVTFTRKKVGARSLSADARAAATTITATASSEPFAIGKPRLLHATVASSALGKDRSGLTDDDLSTRWAESRDDAGGGEFIVMNASVAVPIEGFERVIRPTGEPPMDGSAPKSLYLATDRELFRITLPVDAWTRDPGSAYRAMLPRPVASDCVALVLEEAYGGDKPVSIAELRAITALGRESGKLEELVKLLDDDGPKGSAAAALLLRGGPNAIGAVIAGYPSLAGSGQRRALDVIEGGDCQQSASFWVDRLLGRGHVGPFEPDDDPIAKRAKKALRGCRSAARKALARVVQTEQPGQAQIIAARELALVGPKAALEAVLAVLDAGPKEVRRELRHTITTAARQNSGRAAVAALLAPERFDKLSLVARIDLLRALGQVLAATPGAGAALARVLDADQSFRTRYLLQLPAGQLARGGDRVGLDFLKKSLADDASQHVRGQAARAANQIPALLPALGAALHDRAPRVRHAALEALGGSTGRVAAPVERQILTLLAGDPWTFVRVGAADALAKRPAKPSTDRALVAALEDQAADVRRAVLRTIGARGNKNLVKQVYEVADDARETTRVRAMAIHTLAALCHREAAPLLLKLALRAAAPQLPYDEPLVLASLAALAKLKPAGLEQALAPLLLAKGVPPHVRQSARAAVRSQGSCGDAHQRGVARNSAPAASPSSALANNAPWAR
jgi:hypothetical protein